MNRHSADNGRKTASAAKRSPHTIRFLDSEWERIEQFAEARGLAPAEYVRFATLSAITNNGTSLARLAPIIEQTFRGTYMVASKMRYEMLDAGQDEKLDALVADARKVQQKLQNRASESALDR